MCCTTRGGNRTWEELQLKPDFSEESGFALTRSVSRSIIVQKGQFVQSLGRPMKTLEASQLRQGIADALNTVAYKGDRISIRRHGKPVAVLVSVADAAMLDAIEDHLDVAEAKKAMKEKGSIPWKEVKKRLGLESR